MVPPDSYFAQHGLEGSLSRAVGALRRRDGDRRMRSHFLCPDRPMPDKHNADRRHHIPKMSFKVQNWSAYEAGLRERGSLTWWIEDATLECWQTCGPGGQARYSDAAVTSLLDLIDGRIFQGPADGGD